MIISLSKLFSLRLLVLILLAYSPSVFADKDRALFDTEAAAAEKALSEAVSLTVDSGFQLSEQEMNALIAQIHEIVAGVRVPLVEGIRPIGKLPFNVNDMQIKLADYAPQVIPFDLKDSVRAAILASIADNGGFNSLTVAQKNEIRRDGTLSIAIKKGEFAGRTYTWKLNVVMFGYGDQESVKVILEKGVDGAANQLFVGIPQALFAVDKSALSLPNAVTNLIKGIAGVASETIGLFNWKERSPEDVERRFQDFRQMIAEYAMEASIGDLQKASGLPVEKNPELDLFLVMMESGIREKAARITNEVINEADSRWKKDWTENYKVTFEDEVEKLIEDGRIPSVEARSEVTRRLNKAYIEFMFDELASSEKFTVLNLDTTKANVGQIIAKNFRARLVFLEESQKYSEELAAEARREAEERIRAEHPIRSFSGQYVAREVALVIEQFESERKKEVYQKTADRLQEMGLGIQSLYIKALGDLESDEKLKAEILRNAKRTIEPAVSKTFHFRYWKPRVSTTVDPKSGENVYTLERNASIKLSSTFPGWALIGFNAARFASNFWNSAVGGIQSFTNGFWSPRRFFTGSYTGDWDMNDNGEIQRTDGTLGTRRIIRDSVWKNIAGNWKQSMADYRAERERLSSDAIGSEIVAISRVYNFGRNFLVKAVGGSLAIPVSFGAGAIVNTAVNLGIRIPAIPGAIGYGVLSQTNPDLAPYAAMQMGVAPAYALAKTAVAYAWARLVGSESPASVNESLNSSGNSSFSSEFKSLINRTVPPVSPAASQAMTGLAAGSMATALTYLGLSYAMDTSWINNATGFATPFLGTGISAAMGILLSQPVGKFVDMIATKSTGGYLQGMGRSAAGILGGSLGAYLSLKGVPGTVTSQLEPALNVLHSSGVMNFVNETMAKVTELPVDNPKVLVLSALLGGAQGYMIASKTVGAMSHSTLTHSYNFLKRASLFISLNYAAHYGLSSVDWSLASETALRALGFAGALPLSYIISKMPLLREAERMVLDGVGQLPLMVADQTAKVSVNSQKLALATIEASLGASHNTIMREFVAFTLVDIVLRTVGLEKLGLPSADNSKDMESLIEGPGVMTKIAQTVDRNWAVITLIAQAQLEINLAWRSEMNEENYQYSNQLMRKRLLERHHLIYSLILETLQGKSAQIAITLNDIISTKVAEVRAEIERQFGESKTVIDEFLKVTSATGVIKFTRAEYSKIVDAAADMLKQNISNSLQPSYWVELELTENDYHGLAKHAMQTVYGDNLVVEDAEVRLELVHSSAPEELLGRILEESYSNGTQVVKALNDRTGEVDAKKKTMSSGDRELSRSQIQTAAMLSCDFAFIQ